MYGLGEKGEGRKRKGGFKTKEEERGKEGTEEKKRNMRKRNKNEKSVKKSRN